MSTASRAILSDFFEKQWNQDHPRVVAYTLSDTTFLETAEVLDITNDIFFPSNSKIYGK